MSDMSFVDQFGEVVAPATKRNSASNISYTWLKDRIASIPRDVGMFISEVDVAAGSGTGRTPAREALQRLETEGYLQIIPRKGIYIPPISNAEIGNVMDARRLVEVSCVERVIEGSKLKDHVLDDLIDKQAKLVGEDRSFIEDDRLFHRTIVAAGNNPILAAFYEQLRDRQVRMGLMALSQERDRDLRVIEEHREIARLIRVGATDEARHAVNAHLDNTLAALLGGH